MQELDPVLGWNLPLGQSMQAAPGFDALPAPHRSHDKEEVAPVSATNLPPKQTKQLVASDRPE